MSQITRIAFFVILQWMGLLLVPLTAGAQTPVEPGDGSYDASAVKEGNFNWSWFGGQSELGREVVKVERQKGQIVFTKVRHRKSTGECETDCVMVDGKTLEPVLRVYKGEEVNFSVQYGGKKVVGERTIFRSNKKEPLREPLAGKFFDRQSLPLLVSCLPLSSGYRAILPLIDYDSEFKPAYFRYKVTSVEDMATRSDVSGVHQVWKVTVLENSLGHEHIYYIDKANRRILRSDFNVAQALSSQVSFDTESDVNPIQATFDAEKAMAMISKGNSTIRGQASSKTFDKKKAGFKNDTQFAQKGSPVLLIPNTPYFKEWCDYNLALSRDNPLYTLQWNGLLGNQGEKDRSVIGNYYPLPPEVAKCMLVSTVTDDQGHFAFQNLQPGEYLVFVSFMADKYSHTTRTPTGEYLITLDNSGTAHATALTDVTAWLKPSHVKAYRYVRVTQENEVVEAVFND